MTPVEDPSGLWSEMPQPCFTCGEPTHRVDIDYGAPFCASERCLFLVDQDLREKARAPEQLAQLYFTEEELDACVAIMRDVMRGMDLLREGMAGPNVAEQSRHTWGLYNSLRTMFTEARNGLRVTRKNDDQR